MANADLLITIHAAMLEREFEIEGVVHQLFRDRSGELGDGTTLSLPMDSLTHSDSGQNEGNLRGTTAANLAWGAPTIMTSERDNLVANTGYDFYEVVGDLVRQTIRPDLLSESARQHGRLYANNLSKLCYGGLTGMTRVAAQFESYSVATGDWGNAAHQENILKDLEVVQMKMNHAGAPRQSRFALMNFEDLLVIRQGLRADNIHFSGPINDQLIQMGEFSQFAGFALVGNPQLALEHGSTDDVKHDIYCGVVGEGMSLARRIGLAPEIFRDRVYKGMAIQGSYLFGAAVHQPSKLYGVNCVIT